MTTSREKPEQRKLPMMPIRDMVIFPYMMTPFVVGRESSVRALEEALTGDRKIFLATQHDAGIDEPRPEDIYSVGSIGNIVKSVTMQAAMSRARKTYIRWEPSATSSRASRCRTATSRCWSRD